MDTKWAEEDSVNFFERLDWGCLATSVNHLFGDILVVCNDERLWCVVDMKTFTTNYERVLVYILILMVYVAVASLWFR